MGAAESSNSVFTDEHPDNCTSVYDYDSAGAKLGNFYTFLILSILGLIGNGFIIAVFGRTFRRGEAGSTHVYLVALALADILALITLNFYVHVYVYPYAFPRADGEDFYTAGLYTIGVLPWDHIVRTANVWIVVTLAVDRYVQAAMPGHAEVWCQPKRAAQIVGGIWVTSFIYNIPRFFEYYMMLPHVEEVVDRCFGYFKFFPEGTPAANLVYVWLYAFAIHLLVSYVVPLVLIGVTNFRLIGIVHHQRGWLNESSAQTDGEVSTTHSGRYKDTQMITMLVVVTTFFAICQIPDVVLQIAWRQEVALDHVDDVAIFVYDLLIINSSVNFIIYSLLYRQFRRVVLGYLRIIDFSDVSDPTV